MIEIPGEVIEKAIDAGRNSGAQVIPVPVLTGPVQEVETLEVPARAEKGFGSSGQ